VPLHKAPNVLFDYDLLHLVPLHKAPNVLFETTLDDIKKLFFQPLSTAFLPYLYLHLSPSPSCPASLKLPMQTYKSFIAT
jgi:hypothetical protein